MSPGDYHQSGVKITCSNYCGDNRQRIKEVNHWKNHTVTKSAFLVSSIMIIVTHAWEHTCMGTCVFKREVSRRPVPDPRTGSGSGSSDGQSV